MEKDTTIIILFSIQCILNLSICFWGVYEIGRLRILIEKQRNEMEDIKKDVNNLGSLLRQNRASFEGKLTRFITETSDRFRRLNLNSDFTYPSDTEH